MPQGLFIHLDSSTLSTMATEWTACLSAIANAHQSYSIAGRTFTRANLSEVSKMVSEIAFAQKIVGGTIKRRTFADMSNT